MSLSYACYDILCDTLYTKTCYSFILLIILYAYWFNILMSNYRELNVHNISKSCFNYLPWLHRTRTGWGTCDYDVTLFQSDVTADVTDHVWNAKNHVACAAFLFYDSIYFEPEFDITVVFDFFFWNEITNWTRRIKPFRQTPRMTLSFRPSLKILCSHIQNEAIPSYVVINFLFPDFRASTTNDDSQFYLEKQCFTTQRNL